MIFDLSVLYKIEYDWNIRIDKEVIEFGKQIYGVVLFCPSHLTESRKLNDFFKNFLYDVNYDPQKKSEVNSLVAATFHSLIPGAGSNIKDLTPLNIWYEALGQRYNFSLGPIILGFMTTDRLAQLAKLDVPFLKEYKTYVQNCLNAGECQKMAKLVGKTYIHCYGPENKGLYLDK